MHEHILHIQLSRLKCCFFGSLVKFMRTFESSAYQSVNPKHVTPQVDNLSMGKMCLILIAGLCVHFSLLVAFTSAAGV